MKLTKPRFKATSSRPSPDMAVLLRAEARELLTTWEQLKDKQTIERRLARLDKLYKPGAETEVRRLMHEVKKEERCT